ncbi:MAG: hypothetical protein JRD93_00670 [Deltaproteobacteria bacterium]|nr:hypothetical protein [Deltaproteobacteria bacterium]
MDHKENNRFCVSPKKEELGKSILPDMLQKNDIYKNFEALQSQFGDLYESINNKKDGLKERLDNLWKLVSPELDLLRPLREDSYLKKDFAEEFEKRINKITFSIESFEKQHSTFIEDIKKIKDHFKALSNRIDAAENINEKINEFLSKTRPPQEDFLQSVWPSVEFKVKTLEKLILDHYNEKRDKQLLELNELLQILDGIQQILNQESNRLLPEDRSKKEYEDMANLFTPLFQDIQPIYKRIYSDPDTFLKKYLSDLETSKVNNHLKSFEILSGKSLSSDTEIPDPDRFYREVADNYLNEVKKWYLEKMHNFSSQAYSSLDELRLDLEKFVAHSVFHFLDSTFHDIFQWHEKLQSNGRGFDRHHLEQVRSRMLELCGIQTIEPEVYKSKFDPGVHYESDKGRDTRYSDRIILKVQEPGYEISWTGKVIKKCGVKVNYNSPM